MKRAEVAEYLELIERFLRGDMTARDFSLAYLDLFKKEQRILPEPVYNVLNGLFTDTDTFRPDVELREEGADMTDEEFMSICRAAYRRLQMVVT
jgi:hypothetical protein